MKVEKLSLQELRNAAHCQFHTDCLGTVSKHSADALNIRDQYSEYQRACQTEAEAWAGIAKSASTQEIVDCDHAREITLRGFISQVRCNLNHFDESMRGCARRVLAIVDECVNMVPRPYDEESAMITCLTTDLRTKAWTDLECLCLTDWCTQLEAQNTEFITLETSRNSEECNRTELSMKQARKQTDAAYQKMVERINALVVIAGEDSYREFVQEVNTRIERAMTAMTQSKAQPVRTAAQL